jgi:hypothetical protein
MATVMYWALRMVVCAAGLFALMVNWRVGLVLLFTVATDFIAMIWMILPGFSLQQEVVIVFVGTLPLGILVGAGKNAISPVWLTAALCSGVVAVFQLSSYLIGFDEHTLDPGHAIQTLPAAVILIVASGIGLLLPAVLFRRRLQASRGGARGMPTR